MKLLSLVVLVCLFLAACSKEEPSQVPQISPEEKAAALADEKKKRLAREEAAAQEQKRIEAEALAAEEKTDLEKKELEAKEAHEKLLASHLKAIQALKPKEEGSPQDAAKLKKMAEDGLDVNNPICGNKFVNAAWEGDFDLVKAFLDAGISPDVRAVSLETTKDAFSDLFSKLDSLLGTGPGVTALMTSAKMGRLRVVRLLLEHHADPNARDNSGNTPLLHFHTVNHTSQTQSLDVFEALLEAGADIHAKDDLGNNVLYGCSGGWYTPYFAVRHFEAGVKDVPNNRGETATERLANYVEDYALRYGKESPAYKGHVFKLQIYRGEAKLESKPLRLTAGKDLSVGKEMELSAKGGIFPYRFSVESGEAKIDREKGLLEVSAPGTVRVKVRDALGRDAFLNLQVK